MLKYTTEEKYRVYYYRNKYVVLYKQTQSMRKLVQIKNVPRYSILFTIHLTDF